MVATNPQRKHPIAASAAANTQTSKTHKERLSEARSHAPVRSRAQIQQQPQSHDETPAAGAHAARHLINEDATPGAGVLPSHAHRSGKEVDGGAG